MPRKYRIEVPGGYFHIATRSVYEKFAFGGVGDRTDFLDILNSVIESCGWLLKSYCLLGTHYHLILQTPAANLSVGMQMLNGRYAQRFNWRHGRRGHLFGERFYSVLIESDEHLFNALRYVARNPVEAGLCGAPADWRWSSFRATAGLAAAPRFLDVDGVLALFGVGRHAARAQFARLVEDSRLEDMSDEFPLVRIAGV
jgi:REP-associated tyrosine transposase